MTVEIKIFHDFSICYIKVSELISNILLPFWIIFRHKKTTEESVVFIIFYRKAEVFSEDLHPFSMFQLKLEDQDRL